MTQDHSRVIRLAESPIQPPAVTPADVGGVESDGFTAQPAVVAAPGAPVFVGDVAAPGAPVFVGDRTCLRDGPGTVMEATCQVNLPMFREAPGDRVW